MAVKGSLDEISLVDLIQFNCQIGVSSCLTVKHDSGVAELYFAEGTVVHTALGSRTGKEIFYEILGWENGEFSLERDVEPPTRTITTHWSDLLLGGLHRLDENNGLEQPADEAALPELDDLPEDLGELFGLDRTEESLLEEKDNLAMLDEPEPVHEKPIHKQENKIMKKRSEILADHLQTLLTASSDVNGAVIVGRDGLVMASNITMGGHDATRVGAEGAALLGLSSRTLETLKCGDFEIAILQGKDGWIIASAAGSKAMVMGLTSANVNMGMALLEMRDIALDVAETLA